MAVSFLLNISSPYVVAKKNGGSLTVGHVRALYFKSENNFTFSIDKNGLHLKPE